jgi:uncharacterized protein (TIGR00255 family)
VIKSMTGFAAVSREDERATVAVTVRALNHRYLDLQLRVPQSLAAMEAEIRSLVAKRIARGRVELGIALQLRQVPGVEVEFNESFGRALESALEQARGRGLVSGTLTPGDLLRMPQALTIRERQTDADESTLAAVATQAGDAVDEALRSLDEMRTTEGATCAPISISAARLSRNWSNGSPWRQTRDEPGLKSGSPNGSGSCGSTCRPTRPPWRRRSSRRRRDPTSPKRSPGFAVMSPIGSCSRTG